MNKYGSFKYKDFPLGIEKFAQIEAIGNIQSGSEPQDLVEGVKPYDFASFEQDEYKTANPKPLYLFQQSLGIISQQLSDENGIMADSNDFVGFKATFEKPFILTGITVHSGNVITEAEIKFEYIDENNETQIYTNFFAANNKTFFYEFGAHKINWLQFRVCAIKEAYHFLKLFKVEFGQTRDFNEHKNVKVSFDTHFSVYGDTLKYSTLDLSVIEPKEADYFFQKRQPIDFVLNDEIQMRLYANKGERIDENIIQLTAYNEIANLEDEFLGGIYKDYPLIQLLNDILGEKDKYYNLSYAEELNNIKVNGYLPISSRRKALQTVLLGTNIRHHIDKGIVYKPINTTILNNQIYDETNIVNNPVISKNANIKSVTARLNNYSKGKEELEIYHWYVSTTEDVKINFTQPFHDLKFYEVIGVDEYDNDIISETQSANVTLLKAEPNYCVIRNTSAKKIVIVGKSYIISTVDYVKLNPNIGEYDDYEEIVIDLTLTNDAQAVCDLLYSLYMRKNSVIFNTLVRPIVGEYYEILGNKLNIKSISDNLSGIYEVEAV